MKKPFLMTCCSENVSKGTLVDMRLIKEGAEELQYQIKECPLCQAANTTAIANVDFAEAALKIYDGFKDIEEFTREKKEKAKKDGKARDPVPQTPFVLQNFPRHPLKDSVKRSSCKFVFINVTQSHLLSCLEDKQI